MEKAIIDALIVGGPALVTGWIGFYLGAYLKKKGENLATHEDIGKLVDQVAAVTQTTKEIEAKISSDVWTQQKRWEMKREVLFDAAKRIVELDDGLVTLDVLLRMDDPDSDKWAEHRYKATTGWRDTIKRFDETRILIGIICSKETIWEFENLGLFVGQLGGKLANKDTQIYKESGKDLATHLFRARFAIRKELGIDGAIAPQSK